MKKIVILESEKVEEAKKICSKLCGCADNISYTCGDDETAEEIDRVESGVLKILESARTIELDEITASLISRMCDNEIKAVNEMIRMENVWALGSDSVEQSQIHVENMMRLEKYKIMLTDMMKTVL